MDGDGGAGLLSQPAPLRPGSVTPIIREAVAVVAAFVGLTVVRTFPLVLNLRASLPADLGDPLLNAWILAWDADRLRGGLRGLWDAPIFFPYPKTLGYSEHLLGIAVFTAPLQWLTANPLLVYNLAFLASYALAGVGMYLLVRSLTGRRDAAFVAGAAFAFGPFRDGQIAHLQMLMSGWMPIALWALHRYFASGRRWALGAFVVTFLIQGLSNGYFLYFFSVPVALVLGHGLWKTCRSRIRHQAAAGSWTMPRQWEIQRTWLNSARAAVRSPAKPNGV